MFVSNFKRWRNVFENQVLADGGGQFGLTGILSAFAGPLGLGFGLYQSTNIRAEQAVCTEMLDSYKAFEVQTLNKVEL